MRIPLLTRLGRRGQGVTLEFGVVTVCVVLALATLQQYIMAHCAGAIARPAMNIGGTNYFDPQGTNGQSFHSIDDKSTTKAYVSDYKDGKAEFTFENSGGAKARFDLGETMGGN